MSSGGRKGRSGRGGAAAGGPSGAEQHRSRRNPRLEARRVRSEQPRPASDWPRAQHQTLLELGSQEISPPPCHRSRGSRADLGLHRAKLEPLFSPGSYLFSFKKKKMPTSPAPAWIQPLAFQCTQNLTAKLGVCRYGGERKR